MHFLDFEEPIEELLGMIDELKKLENSDTLSIQSEIKALENKVHKLTNKVFKKLTPWNKVQLARHPQRPLAQDYIDCIFENFTQLHGDRAYADDKALIGGIGLIKNIPVMILAQQKGRTAEEKMYHNFGMMHPEGYRKAKRLALLAEKFKMPIVTLIDTPGAYPGVGAEERGQSEAIATNLKVFSKINTPVISLIIGEGCSGGALGIGVCDRLLMLEYSYFATISPEGCASILYKSASKASVACEAMKITPDELLEQGIIDAIIDEPLGGAHRDKESHFSAVSQRIFEEVDMLMRVPKEDLLSKRYQKIRSYGKFTTANSY